MPQPIVNAILMRHAQKDESITAHFGYDAPLTPEGCDAARALGTSWQDSIGPIISSPVPRCVETAKHLGLNTAPCLTSTALGDPGIYISDPEAAGTHFTRDTPQAIAQSLLKEPHTRPGFKQNTVQTSQELLHKLYQQAHTSSRTPVFITHDIIMALFLASLLSIYDVPILWPNNLEYCTLHWHASGCRLIYRTYSLNLPLNIAYDTATVTV